MNIQEKVKELKNTRCIGIKEKELDFYSRFLEFELDNGEFILINDYIYCGKKLNQEEEPIDDGWCVYKESVIDRISSDNADDEFWENCDDYFSDDFKLYIYDRIGEENIVTEVYNQYIDVINNNWSKRS